MHPTGGLSTIGWVYRQTRKALKTDVFGRTCGSSTGLSTVYPPELSKCCMQFLELTQDVVRDTLTRHTRNGRGKGMFTEIIKRDGRTEAFDRKKIQSAIWKACCLLS